MCVFYETVKVSNLEQVTETVIPKIQKTATVDLTTINSYWRQ